MPILSSFAAGSSRSFGMANFAGGELLPPITNYIALYTASTISGTTFGDHTGNYNATISGSGYSVVSTTGNGATETFDALQGSTSTVITFPSGILPSTYTFFHVARHNGTRRRIFLGGDKNWLSGFWQGNSGVAYHEGWLTPQVDRHGGNWVISTDQKGLYRSNGVQRSDSTGGNTNTAQLRVNTGVYGSETSDFLIAEVIVYNYSMNSTQYGQIESYLSTKYGI